MFQYWLTTEESEDGILFLYYYDKNIKISMILIDLNIFLLMNYILHFFFTIQYNMGFGNKRNA
jgi:hypothetical protein